MMESSLAQPLPGSTRDAQDRPSFVASHRALAVCTREFGRLTNEVAAALTALHGAGEIEKALVVHSPGRCIVQVGPVALTIAWLRSRLDVVADGELLVVVWHGAVAPPAARFRERVLKGPTATGAGPSAKALWEEVLSVQADSEESWRWHPTGASAKADAPSTSYTSVELAARTVERLRLAYAEHHTNA